MRGGGGGGGRGFSGGGGRGFSGSGGSFRSSVVGTEHVTIAAACGKSSTPGHFVQGGESDEHHRALDYFKTWPREKRCRAFINLLETHLSLHGINGRFRPFMLPSFFEEWLADCPEAPNLKNLVMRFSSELDELLTRYEFQSCLLISWLAWTQDRIR